MEEQENCHEQFLIVTVLLRTPGDTFLYVTFPLCFLYVSFMFPLCYVMNSS